MTKKDVKVGSCYLAKVSDRIVAVRIDSTNSHGGWNATNTATGKRIHIKSVQRLRGPAETDTAAAEEPASEQAVDVNASSAESGSPPSDATPPAAAGAGAGPAPKHVSLLDAAIEVLRAAGTAMRCKDLVTAVATAGTWSSPAGKTPEATLYSAFLREIQAKGDQARIRKIERGQFAIAGVP